MTLQAAAVLMPPLAVVLRVVTLDALAWGVVVLAAVMPALGGEARKAWRQKVASREAM